MLKKRNLLFIALVIVALLVVACEPSNAEVIATSRAVGQQLNGSLSEAETAVAAAVTEEAPAEEANIVKEEGQGRLEVTFVSPDGEFVYVVDKMFALEEGTIMWGTSTSHPMSGCHNDGWEKIESETFGIDLKNVLAVINNEEIIYRDNDGEQRYARDTEVIDVLPLLGPNDETFTLGLMHCDNGSNYYRMEVEPLDLTNPLYSTSLFNLYEAEPVSVVDYSCEAVKNVEYEIPEFEIIFENGEATVTPNLVKFQEQETPLADGQVALFNLEGSNYSAAVLSCNGNVYLNALHKDNNEH